MDSKRPDLTSPVAQDERGTYFFDAKDLCGLPLLDQIVETGVRSLKIEGRTRSAHYVGTTVDVYRTAFDQLARGDLVGFRRDVASGVAELAKPVSRGFSTHFLGGEENFLETSNPHGSYRGTTRNEFAGMVVATRADGLIVSLKNPVRPGNTVEIRDRGLISETAELNPVVLRDGSPVDLARSGEEILIPGRFQSGRGAMVRFS